MEVFVLHHNEEGSADESGFEQVYEETVDEDAPDEALLRAAFERTQTVDLSWNRDAPWMRSTEVGDVIGLQSGDGAPRLYLVVEVRDLRPHSFTPPTATFERIDEVSIVS